MCELFFPGLFSQNGGGVPTRNPFPKGWSSLFLVPFKNHPRRAPTPKKHTQLVARELRGYGNAFWHRVGPLGRAMTKLQRVRMNRVSHFSGNPSLWGGKKLTARFTNKTSSTLREQHGPTQPRVPSPQMFYGISNRHPSKPARPFFDFFQDSLTKPGPLLVWLLNETPEGNNPV